jgi:PHD/YefM family antitoxin component YafN of YafNO toxin-antitoxin module
MLRTITITEFRANLSTMLAELEEGPLLILSKDKPAAILIEPGMFETLIQRVELLEDLISGRQAIADYTDDPDISFNAAEVFKKIGD